MPHDLVFGYLPLAKCQLQPQLGRLNRVTSAEHRAFSLPLSQDGLWNQEEKCVYVIWLTLWKFPFLSIRQLLFGRDLFSFNIYLKNFLSLYVVSFFFQRFLIFLCFSHRKFLSRPKVSNKKYRNLNFYPVLSHALLRFKKKKAGGGAKMAE